MNQLVKQKDLQSKPQIYIKNFQEIISDDLEISCKVVSKYAKDIPMNKMEAIAQAVKIGNEFKISEYKVELLAEIFLEEKWSLRKVKDAIKYIIKKNIYNTANVGIEPGKILSYDKHIKFYTQGDLIQMQDNDIGYTLVSVPDLYRHSDYGKINNWYIKDQDFEEFKELFYGK